MANEKGRNKKKKDQKRRDRLSRLIGIDLCACGAGNQSKCQGPCRVAHTDETTGQVKCCELYRIDNASMNQSDTRKPKRDWKFGRQREGRDNKSDRQKRREKFERDRLE